MPYIFISAVALCANLYRCAPLIVGDKFADPELMKFLGAKITTDYPEPNSPPMYVMFATMRSVLDALQEIGYELNSSHVVQGYTTWIMYKPLEGEAKQGKLSTKPSDDAVDIESEPQAMAFKPRREEPTKVDKAVETEERGLAHCFELSAEESKELRELSSRSLKNKLKEHARKGASPRKRPIPEVDESTSTSDMHSASVKSMKTGSELSRTESSSTKRQNLGPKESNTEEIQEPETKPKTTESSSSNNPRKVNKWGRSSSDTSSRDPSPKHKGTKAHGRKSSSAVKENFKHP